MLEQCLPLVLQNKKTLHTIKGKNKFWGADF